MCSRCNQTKPNQQTAHVIYYPTKGTREVKLVRRHVRLHQGVLSNDLLKYSSFAIYHALAMHFEFIIGELILNMNMDKNHGICHAIFLQGIRYKKEIR